MQAYWLNSKNLSGSAYDGQCVSYVKNARADLTGTWGNPVGAASAFDESHEVNSLPRIGAAFTIPAYGFGHTGIVTDVRLENKGGQLFYKVSFNDANRGGTGEKPELGPDGTGIIRSGVVLLTYPGAEGNFSFVKRGTANEVSKTHSYKFTFIHEKQDDYDAKLKTINYYLKQLFDSELLASRKRNGRTIAFSAYTGKYFTEKFLLFTKDDFSKFLQVVSLYKTEYGRSADVGGLRHNITDILSGLSVDDIKIKMQKTNEWKNAHQTWNN